MRPCSGTHPLVQPQAPDRTKILRAVDLASLVDQLLGPGRPCPGHHHGGARPELAVSGAGVGARWRCRACRDGGTAVDLVALVRRCGTDEAVAELARIVADVAPRPEAARQAAPSVAGRRLPPVGVVVQAQEGEHELVVDAAAAATVGHLAAVVLGRPSGLEIDGTSVAEDATLVTSGLLEGSVVGPVVPVDARPAPPLVELRWIEGIDAGRTDRLAAGSWVIGTSSRASLCRVDAGGPQAAILEVGPHGDLQVDALLAGVAELTADGQTAGSPRPMLRVGQGRAMVRYLSADSAPLGPAVRPCPVPGRWTRPVVRRADRVAFEADEPEAPATEPALPRPAAPSVLPPLLSLGAGVVLAVVTRQPLLLILGGVGAAGSVGTWAWQRVRHATARRRQRREHALAWRRYQEADDAWRVARSREHGQRYPDLTVVAERIVRGADALWASRCGRGTALRLAVGECPSGAVVVDLAPGEALAIVGPAAATAAVARAMVVRLAADHGPADLMVDATTGCRDPWQWADWLPHTGGPLAEPAPTPAGSDGFRRAGDRPPPGARRPPLAREPFGPGAPDAGRRRERDRPRRAERRPAAGLPPRPHHHHLCSGGTVGGTVGSPWRSPSGARGPDRGQRPGAPNSARARPAARPLARSRAARQLGAAGDGPLELASRSRCLGRSHDCLGLGRPPKGWRVAPHPARRGRRR